MNTAATATAKHFIYALDAQQLESLEKDGYASLSLGGAEGLDQVGRGSTLSLYVSEKMSYAAMLIVESKDADGNLATRLLVDLPAKDWVKWISMQDNLDYLRQWPKVAWGPDSKGSLRKISAKDSTVIQRSLSMAKECPKPEKKAPPAKPEAS